jgi:predicted HTH transcriptional regulator
MLLHTVYAIIGGAVSVSIYPNHIEIASHGRLPLGVTTDILRLKHESSPRNELISVRIKFIYK